MSRHNLWPPSLPTFILCNNRLLAGNVHMSEFMIQSIVGRYAFLFLCNFPYFLGLDAEVALVKKTIDYLGNHNNFLKIATLLSPNFLLTRLVAVGTFFDIRVIPCQVYATFCMSVSNFSQTYFMGREGVMRHD